MRSIVTLFNFLLPSSHTPYVSNKKTPNLTSTNDKTTSTEPSPPIVIPYSTNVPTNPNLQDGNFTATSLFDTNKFLNSNVHNIACLLQCMAYFLRQRNLKGCNGNNIR